MARREVVIASFFIVMLVIVLIVLGTLTGYAIIDAGGEPVSEKIVKLDKGWNMVSLPIGEQDASMTDRTLTLKKGWNLIGYSSTVKPTVSIAEEVKVSGKKFGEATRLRVIQGQLAYYDSDKQQYGLAPLGKPNLEMNKGYWVYSNDASDVSMTLEGVGGSQVGASIQVSELKFRRTSTGEEVVGWEAAKNIGLIIDGYSWNMNNGLGTFIPVLDDSLMNSWEGVFIQTAYDDVEIVV